MNFEGNIYIHINKKFREELFIHLNEIEIKSRKWDSILRYEEIKDFLSKDSKEYIRTSLKLKDLKDKQKFQLFQIISYIDTYDLVKILFYMGYEDVAYTVHDNFIEYTLDGTVCETDGLWNACGAEFSRDYNIKRMLKDPSFVMDLDKLYNEKIKINSDLGKIL